MIEMWDVLDNQGEKTGKVQERGWMQPGNYHLIVNVWIRNKNGELLISKRMPDKRWPSMWGCTIGSAVSGDDSLATAIKETSEELGIILNPEKGKMFKRYKNSFPGDCGEFIDVWIFEHEIDISEIILKPDETCDAKWITVDALNEMFEEKTFIPKEDLPFVGEVLNEDKS